MNDTAWDRLTDAIDIKFGLNRHGRLERPLDDAPHLREQVQFVEFERAGQTYRLERSTGPAIVERKAIGGHRIGASVHYQNTYDATEEQSKVRLLQQAGSDWEPVEIDQLGL
jgi:hypothetical protein